METTETFDEPQIHAAREGQSRYERMVTRTEEYTRQEPLKAVGVAFGAGLLLTLLPIGGIIAGLFRLAFALVRPALMVLGALKLYEEAERRRNF